MYRSHVILQLSHVVIQVSLTQGGNGVHWRVAQHIAPLHQTDHRITEDSASPDRQFLLPSADEERTLKENKQPFQWEIAEELLTREFLGEKKAAEPERDAVPEASSPVGAGEWSMLLAMLQKQLEEKDDQLRRKDEHIVQLTERLKEQNILQQTTLKALPSGGVNDEAMTVPSSPVGESAVEKSSNEEGSGDVQETAAKTKSAGTTKPRKGTKKAKGTGKTDRGFWSGLFGR